MPRPRSGYAVEVVGSTNITWRESAARSTTVRIAATWVYRVGGAFDVVGTANGVVIQSRNTRYFTLKVSGDNGVCVWSVVLPPVGGLIAVEM